MPYIDSAQRVEFDLAFNRLPERDLTAGQYAYCVWRITQRFLSTWKGKSFAAFATTVGVLVCIVLEMYRRQVVPFEEEKIAKNGDAIESVKE